VKKNAIFASNNLWTTLVLVGLHSVLLIYFCVLFVQVRMEL